ncbi:MAG: hypothetical protein JSW25_05335 [Thermoplasmata archaeon]|nr:MAG: hypothetical protein JSW25_05335 [Thermoplasmata archaeon]
MGKDEQPEGGADIEVAPPEVGSVDGPSPEQGGAKNMAKKAIEAPKDVARRLRRRYQGLNKRDKFAALLGVLAIVMFLVLMAIWTTGGGIGGPSLGPEILPSSRWNIDALEEVPVAGNEENTNLEGQLTPYLAPLTPQPGEIYFLTDMTCSVTWTDESTPPTSAPAIGYTNEPDGFQLIIRIHDDVGEWESEIIFNPQGSSGQIDLPVILSEHLGAPLAVANPHGANYLPQGYVESVRVDFIVRTDECGEWTSSDPFRPTIGDGGNHYTFDWSLVYRTADSTKSP